MFGLCSLLIPAGYNNIAYFYQCPDQALIVYSINPNEPQVEQRIVDRYGEGDNGRQGMGKLQRKNTLLDDVEAEAFSGKKSKYVKLSKFLQIEDQFVILPLACSLVLPCRSFRFVMSRFCKS